MTGLRRVPMPPTLTSTTSPEDKRRNARRRARGDHVAGLERHDLSDEADYNIKGKNHLGGVGRLFRYAVDEGFDGSPAGSMAGFHHRAEGTESIEAFYAGKLDVEFLQVARGDVIQAGVAEDVGPDVVRIGEMRAAPADDRWRARLRNRRAGKLGGRTMGSSGAMMAEGGLGKSAALLDLAVQFLGVIEIIVADADDLGGDGRRKQFDRSSGQFRPVSSRVPHSSP